MLATLLLNAGRVTQVDTLIDALWDEPPPSAKAQLHNMVSKLRRRLRDCGDDVIVSRSGGYELRLGAHELDLLEFRRLAGRGRQATDAGDTAEAAELLTEALALWRGPALADVADDLVAGVRQALHEEKIAVAEEAIEAQLSVGRIDDVLRELAGLIAEHPYRESLHVQQMLALVGAGRRAEALEHYRRTYRRFADELGVEPGRPMRALVQQILRDEAPTPMRAAGGPPVPRQVPPSSVELTGRDKLLGEIAEELGSGQDAGSPVALLVGPAGVGKTALALAAANRMAVRFTDGQLYADLRGRADPHAVTGRFLRALGVDSSTLPEDRDERTALYRSHLAGKRILVVLDDAGSEEQVRALLAGSDGCRTLITSRHQLGALFGAARWTVPVLATPDAVDLFTAIVGPQRVTTEPEAATEIVELCAHLPLALSIAAARLAARPQWTLEEFRSRLARERGRLDELSVGDLDVRASIALSYDALDVENRRLFRRLGLVEAPDWPAWVGDPLIGRPAARLLDQLVDAHLIEPLGRDAVGQQRFRLHDLVVTFATERAREDDDDAERSSAVSRLLSGWLALATEADERVTHELIPAPALEIPPAPPGTVDLVRQTPSGWFEVERHSLVLAVGQASRLGLPDLAGPLALRVGGFLGSRPSEDDWDLALRQAISCLRAHDSRELLMQLLAALFMACLRRDRYAELPAIAAEELTEARLLGDHEAQVRALRHAAVAADRQGRFDEAINQLEHAVDAASQPDVDPMLLLGSLDSLGATLHQIGHAERAVALFERALDLGSVSHSSLQYAHCLYHNGIALTALGRLAEAERMLTESLRINRDLDHEVGVAYMEQALADVDIRAGRLRRAGDRLDRARRTHEIGGGGGDGLAETMRALGELAVAEGRLADAVSSMCAALNIFGRIGSEIDVARTLARLERVHEALGDQDAAVSCRSAYQAILVTLNLDERCFYLPNREAAGRPR